MNTELDGGCINFKTDIDGSRVSFDITSAYNAVSGTMTFEEIDNLITMLMQQRSALWNSMEKTKNE